MKKIRISAGPGLSLLFVIFLAGCNGKKSESSSSGSAVTHQEIKQDKLTEGALLLKELAENGDYVNSRDFPSLIKASIVYEELDSNNLIIDIRDGRSYSSGHIKGSVNVGFSSLPEYFESAIKPFEYDKIIIVCDDGQLSSYTTSLLRLKGYGNVYSMRWGMGGWNKNYAMKSWLKGVSGRYEDRLETTVNEVPAQSALPELNTGLSVGRELLDARFRDIFSSGTDSILISPEKVFNNPSEYFIINLERKDKYESGHIPGAIRYKPESTLGFADVMSTISVNKPVVIYCGTGHNSAFATAFLRLCGYDARTLKYGNNSFMYDKMTKDKSLLSWLPFTLGESNDFPVVK